MEFETFPSKRIVGIRTAHLWTHSEVIATDLDPNGGFNPWLLAIVLTGGLYVQRWIKSIGIFAPKRNT